MANQKLEPLLNLALMTPEETRERSQILEVGFSSASRTWELIVKYNGDIKRLESDVIQVEELIAGYAVVTLPEDLVEAFSQLEEVEYVEKPKRLYFSVLQGKEASCILPVTIRSPFLTGRGVLVAVIDSGIDYTSPEFTDRAGNTRILSLWDQTLLPERVDALLPEGYEEFAIAAPPVGFNTGVEFSSQRINAALQSTTPQLIVPSRDSSGHGTAVAAIAAAGGRLDQGRYQGVAPESSLLVVKLGNSLPNSFPRTTELMRALTYVVRKSLELGMPLSINLSFGNTYGSHDGTSLVERFLDNVGEIGRTVICVGSGNEGAAGGHTAGRLETGEVKRVELAVGNYQTAFSVQLWKEYVDDFGLELISPGGQSTVVELSSPDAVSIMLEGTELLVYVGEPSPYSVSQEIYLDFLPLGSYVTPGIWSFVFSPRKIVGGNYDLYLPSNSVLNEATRFFAPVPDKTLTIPSTASKVITVGAYNASYSAYADFSGRGYPLISASQGRMPEQTIKPDLAAPGVNINTIGPEGTFVQVSGTSFATPFVAGSAALLMEWGIVKGNDPFLYGEKVKAYLRKGAVPIRGENVYPNDRVGYGALCLNSSFPT